MAKCAVRTCKQDARLRVTVITRLRPSRPTDERATRSVCREHVTAFGAPVQVQHTTREGA